LRSTVAEDGMGWLKGLSLEYEVFELGRGESGAATTCVAFDAAAADPAAFVAVTTTRSVKPTSDEDAW
jgi:hypothetical protein